MNEVILLVRMWVEKQILYIDFDSMNRHPPCEDVSWKNKNKYMSRVIKCHPPCEDVSWKINKGIPWKRSLRSSSLWGCELKRIGGKKMIKTRKSSSLWGCELKNLSQHPIPARSRHPPCEDVSWKCNIPCRVLHFFRHPPCEDVSWKVVKEVGDTASIVVILLVRMWVEKPVHPA